MEPGGFEKVVEELLVGTSKSIRNQQLYSNHPRLQPREGEILGRDDDIKMILAFLNSDATAPHVHGLAGICAREVAVLGSALGPFYWDERLVHPRRVANELRFCRQNGALKLRDLAHTIISRGTGSNSVIQLAEFESYRAHRPPI